MSIDRVVPTSRCHPTWSEADVCLPRWINSRKEVIQPQVPLRLPCYDFTPVTRHSLGGCLPKG